MINVDHNPVETEEGVWTPFNGSEFLIAHVSNMAFQRKLARLQQPYAKKIEKGTLSPDVQMDILCEAMSGTVLKNWRKVVNSKNEDVGFDVELGKRVLLKQVEVREFVTDYAGNLDHYRQEEVKELGKS